jgi:hypothetical protein
LPPPRWRWRASSRPLPRKPTSGSAASSRRSPPIPGRREQQLHDQRPLHRVGRRRQRAGHDVFEGLPDTPITRFELNFDADKLIATTRDLCQPPPPEFHADFEGHNGRKRSSDVAADVEGCGANTAKPTAKVKLRRSQSDHPRMKAKVKAGISGLKKMKLKLPKQLRFGGGRDFKRGAKASDGDLGAGSRKLKLNADEGVTKFKVRVAKHGLDRVKPIKKGKRLKFPITVTDVGGDKTKIKAKAKAR